MSAYFARRFLSMIPLFLGITFISFIVIHLAPASAVDARSAFNPKMTAQAKEKLREIYGLDRPLWEQYTGWVARLAVLDFGNSFVDGEKVTAKIAEALPVTVALNGISLFLIFLFGVPLGVAGAVRPGSLEDKAGTFFALAAFSLPSYWFALLLMNLFGVHWRLFPVSGLHSVLADTLPSWQRFADVAWHAALPLLAASLPGIGGISRYMRSAMAETLRQDYVRAARARGLSEKKVIYGHALKNALLPVITLLGLSLPALLGGSVLFETIFSIPGMGRLFYNAVFARDYPVIMGILVLGAVLTLLGNLLADAAYGMADPRAREALK